jgi:hypothetical protein
MTDHELVQQTALKFLQQHGSTAVDRLREFAEIAAETGDSLSAEAWQDIADAAERLSPAYQFQNTESSL